jgi:CheY-like chemotaxis protein
MARISVVDDNSEVRKVIRMILEIDGHEVREFESGQDFLEKLGTGEWPDLILLDVMMPEIDGWAVSRKIKTEIDRNIPICILTTRGGQSRRAPQQTNIN